jgi:hypothetical protein
MAEHYRPKIGKAKAGYYQGYYCGRCGRPGLSMMGRCSKHTRSEEKWDYRSGRWIDKPISKGVCIANPTLVAKLAEANTEEAERKRIFKRKLVYGEPVQADWEIDI